MKPEERVRQWFIAQLHQAGVESYRIATEYSVKVGTRNLRADIVVFAHATTVPIAIVECKAPNVELTELTIRQAAIYNAQLWATYIIVTNGLKTYIFDCKSNCYIDKLPENM